MQPITDILILVAIFVSVLLLSFTILSGLGRSRQIARNLERASDLRTATTAGSMPPSPMKTPSSAIIMRSSERTTPKAWKCG